MQTKNVHMITMPTWFFWATVWILGSGAVMNVTTNALRWVFPYTPATQQCQELDERYLGWEISIGVICGAPAAFIPNEARSHEPADEG